MGKHKNKRSAIIKYADVFDYEHLLASHLKCRSGKRTRETNVRYDAYEWRNIINLADRLREDRYTIRSLYSFTIYEPKQREIVANQYEDKIVQRCLCDYVLQPAIAPKLIYDNYASQPGKGTDMARERFAMFLGEYVDRYHNNKGYVLQIDIKSYFASIDREILCGMVDKLAVDDRCKELIRMEIYAYDTESSCGVCIGFQSMQWLAVYYLNGLDHYIKEKLGARWYGRYMDDMFIIHDNLDELKVWFDDISAYITERLNLRVNPKSAIRPLRDNITWLGFQFTITDDNTVTSRVTKSTLKRYVRRLRKYNADKRSGTISEESIMCSINSIRAHIIKAKKGKSLVKYLDERVVDIFGQDFFERLNKAHKYPAPKRVMTPRKKAKKSPLP